MYIHRCDVGLSNCDYTSQLTIPILRTRTLCACLQPLYIYTEYCQATLYTYVHSICSRTAIAVKLSVLQCLCSEVHTLKAASLQLCPLVLFLPLCRERRVLTHCMEGRLLASSLPSCTCQQITFTMHPATMTSGLPCRSCYSCSRTVSWASLTLSQTACTTRSPGEVKSWAHKKEMCHGTCHACTYVRMCNKLRGLLWHLPLHGGVVCIVASS